MRPDPWTCAVCGVTHVVPSLARRCETKHQTTTTTDFDDSEDQR